MSLLLRERLSQFLNPVYRSKAGLWVGGLLLPKHENVLAVLGTRSGLLLYGAHNLVTTAGDTYYAQRGAGAAPTNAFGLGELSSAGVPAKGATRAAFTPIAATQKTFTATYPKTADADVDNTGAGANVVTYQWAYAKADFAAATISHGQITNAVPAVGEPLLAGFAFTAAFGKTVDDTLKIIVNHQLIGI